MKTLDISANNIFESRFAPSNDTSDFLGMCFGSKKCKRRRAERQRRRKERHRAKMLKESAKAQAIEDGTFQSAGSGLLNSLGGALGSILGGGAGAGVGVSQQIESGASTDFPEEKPQKKNNTIIYIVVAVLLVAGFGFYAMNKSKK